MTDQVIHARDVMFYVGGGEGAQHRQPPRLAVFDNQGRCQLIVQADTWAELDNLIFDAEQAVSAGTRRASFTGCPADNIPK